MGVSPVFVRRILSCSIFGDHPTMGGFPVGFLLKLPTTWHRQPKSPPPLPGPPGSRPSARRTDRTAARRCNGVEVASREALAAQVASCGDSVPMALERSRRCRCSKGSLPTPRIPVFLENRQKPGENWWKRRGNQPLEVPEVDWGLMLTYLQLYPSRDL